MRTVHEVSKLTGVSVRTLHHYDAIGLLKPAKTTEAGYRLYDDASLELLQTILLFRELQFPLKEIKDIISQPNFDRSLALEQQIKLLALQRKRLGELITLAEDLLTGGNDMSFKAFDKSELESYAAEAKEKWGQTQAYKEFEEKQTEPQTDGLMACFAALGKLRKLPADSTQVQGAVENIRSFITANFYNCTPPIFRSLGQMYIMDERFAANIDAVGGEGTAKLASDAIEIYCNSH